MDNFSKAVSHEHVYNIRKSLLTFIRDNENPKKLFRSSYIVPQVYFNLNTEKQSNNECWRIVSMKSSGSNNNKGSKNEINKEIVWDKHPKTHHKPNKHAQSSTNINSIIKAKPNKVYTKLKTISPRSALQVIRDLAKDRLTLRSASPKLGMSHNALRSRDNSPVLISINLHQRILRKRSSEYYTQENNFSALEKSERSLNYSDMMDSERRENIGGFGH